MKRSKGWLWLAIWMGMWAPKQIGAQVQDYPFEVEEFSFVQYGQNHLRFPGDSSAFTRLFEKMDRLLLEGEGQIKVVHIGGSHIQADIWSDRMRQRMQTYYPGNTGGRGFIFPFSMAKTNNPWHYHPVYTGEWESCRNVERDKTEPLGLSGISVTTRDTLSSLQIGFRGAGYPQYEFNAVRVFHDMDSSSYAVRWALDSVPAIVLVDSAAGYTEFRLASYVSKLHLKFLKTDSIQDHFTLYGIGLQTEDPGIEYIAVGVNGASVPSYLRCQMFSQHLATIQPDLVVLSIGINDANTRSFDDRGYERNYDELVAQIRAASPETAILFTTNNDSYYRRRYPNKNAVQVRETMLRLGKKHGAAVWDMFGVMGGLGSIRTWERAGLAKKDRIHLTREGYVLVADLLFNALMEKYDQHLFGMKPR